MMTVSELEARFPYMFLGGDIGITHYRGWFPFFVQACVEVDAILGDDKRGFHWFQVKEKFGAARFYFQMESRRTTQTDPDGEEYRARAAEETTVRVSRAIDHAESLTEQACIVCGLTAQVTSLDGYYLTLCPDHCPPPGLTRQGLRAHLKVLARQWKAD